jgi:hypothetical protein
MDKKTLLQQVWSLGLTYPKYQALVDELVVQEKTTGEDQSEKMVNYTKLNASRMHRWLKTAKVSDEVVAELSNKKISILAITEAWCGDTAQNLPYFHLLASKANIPYQLCLRDEQPELMEHFLTNGGKAIPIVIFMNDNFEVLATWGPRPKPVQQMVMDYKQLPEPKPSYDEFSIDVQKWYNADKMQTLEQEVLSVLKNIA